MEKAAYPLHAALLRIERAHVVDTKKTDLAPTDTIDDLPGAMTSKRNAVIDAAEALTVGAPVLHRKIAV